MRSSFLAIVALLSVAATAFISEARVPDSRSCSIDLSIHEDVTAVRRHRFSDPAEYSYWYRCRLTFPSLIDLELHQLAGCQHYPDGE